MEEIVKETFKSAPIFQYAMALVMVVILVMYGRKMINSILSGEDSANHHSEPIDHWRMVMSTTERIERANNDRFTRIDQCIAEMDREMQEGFRRTERVLTDISKDVIAINNNRPTRRPRGGQ